MSKRTRDEAGLPIAGSLPANSISHAQKKCKIDINWRSFRIFDVPRYAISKLKRRNVEGTEQEPEKKRLKTSTSLITDLEISNDTTLAPLIAPPPAINLDVSSTKKLEKPTVHVPQSNMSDKTFTTNATPTTFPKFQKLVPELRHMIWKASILPRVVALTNTPTEDVQPQPANSSTSRVTPSWRSSAPIPALLHVCRDSRSFGLSFYKLSFGTPIQPGKIYFNIAQDTLHLPQLDETNTTPQGKATNHRTIAAICTIPREERDLITHIALLNPKFGPGNPIWPMEYNRGRAIMLALLPALTCFMKTKNITLVHKNFFDEGEQGKRMGHGDIEKYTFLKPLFALGERSGLSEGKFCRKYQLLERGEGFERRWGGDGVEDGGDADDKLWKGMCKELYVKVRSLWASTCGECSEEMGGEGKGFPEIEYKVLGSKRLRKKVEIMIEKGLLERVVEGGGFWKDPEDSKLEQ